jgi:hypothetical protein
LLDGERRLEQPALNVDGDGVQTLVLDLRDVCVGDIVEVRLRMAGPSRPEAVLVDDGYVLQTVESEVRFSGYRVPSRAWKVVVSAALCVSAAFAWDTIDKPAENAAMARPASLDARFVARTAPIREIDDMIK